MLTTVHDEIMFEIKDNERLMKHKEAIDNIMENTVKLDIKLTTDGKIGMDYGECK
jgi:DNA polymerase I-like protein with 3'-5' exonuclease and polymerase domains